MVIKNLHRLVRVKNVTKGEKILKICPPEIKTVDLFRLL